MQKITVDFPPKQAEELAIRLVERLDLPAKLRLAEKLSRETRRVRWEPLISKMQKRFSQRPLSAREIRKLCEEVLQERFERSGRR